MNYIVFMRTVANGLFTVGENYTTEQVAEILGIDRHALTTGVFKPAKKNFVLIFVTEKKEPGDVQYNDKLMGNILEWDGQNAGRTDKLIINNTRNDPELILMYRAYRNENDDYSYKCKGNLCYKSHEGSHPTHFILEVC